MIKVDIVHGGMRVSHGDRTVLVATTAGEEDAEGTPTLIVSLDGIETWDPQGAGPAVSIDELKEIAAAIERAARRFGIAVEFS